MQFISYYTYRAQFFKSLIAHEVFSHHLCLIHVLRVMLSNSFHNPSYPLASSLPLPSITLKFLHYFQAHPILLAVMRKVWSCCPKNWKSFSSSCYFFSTDAKSWNSSQENCSRMEAHLVVINSKEEQDFLTQNMAKTAAYFVGLSDPEGHGHWQWVDQTPYNQSATFWHPGEPSHSEERCVIVNHPSTSSKWGWNDIRCKVHYRSVCEMMNFYL
uniref:C-type lectin domain-containing protein n=1 Tax=Spermophilus dauricus TaxID=99837 RepID=A0A8C9UX47_SPEDA